MPPTSLVWLRNCHFRLKKTTCAPAKKKKKNRCTQEFILSVYFLSSQPWTLPFFFLSLSGYSRHPGYRGSASITSASFWELKSSRQLVAQSWIRMSFSKWTIFNQTFLWFPRARGPPLLPAGHCPYSTQYTRALKHNGKETWWSSLAQWSQLSLWVLSRAQAGNTHPTTMHDGIKHGVSPSIYTRQKQIPHIHTGELQTDTDGIRHWSVFGKTVFACLVGIWAREERAESSPMLSCLVEMLTSAQDLSTPLHSGLPLNGISLQRKAQLAEGPATQTPWVWLPLHVINFYRVKTTNWCELNTEKLQHFCPGKMRTLPMSCPGLVFADATEQSWSLIP